MRNKSLFNNVKDIKVVFIIIFTELFLCPAAVAFPPYFFWVCWHLPIIWMAWSPENKFWRFQVLNLEPLGYEQPLLTTRPPPRPNLQGRAKTGSTYTYLIYYRQSDLPTRELYALYSCMSVSSWHPKADTTQYLPNFYCNDTRVVFEFRVYFSMRKVKWKILKRKSEEGHL